MQRRSNRGLVGDILAMTQAVPWWVSAGLAVVSFVLFHSMASISLSQAATPEDVGRNASRIMLRYAGFFLQWVVPLLFVIGAISRVYGDRRRRQLLLNVADNSSSHAISGISWHEFERLLQEAFQLQGYKVTRHGGNGPDGGIDLLLQRDSERIFVQCKHWRAMKVGVTVVRELYGVMAAEGATGGIIATSGTFTVDAERFANGRNIDLLNGSELAMMIKSVRASDSEIRNAEPAQKSIVPEKTLCPLCASPMTRRVARHGTNAGREFWGCSRFPACRGTRT
jgi:restriction system protein